MVCLKNVLWFTLLLTAQSCQTQYNFGFSQCIFYVNYINYWSCTGNFRFEKCIIQSGLGSRDPQISYTDWTTCTKECCDPTVTYSQNEDGIVQCQDYMNSSMTHKTLIAMLSTIAGFAFLFLIAFCFFYCKRVSQQRQLDAYAYQHATYNRDMDRIRENQAYYNSSQNQLQLSMRRPNNVPQIDPEESAPRPVDPRPVDQRPAPRPVALRPVDLRPVALRPVVLSANIRPKSINSWPRDQLKNIKLLKEICSICLYRNLTIQLQCGHVYHKKCIIQCLNHKQKCPLCRSTNFKNVKSYCSKCQLAYSTANLQKNLDQFKKLEQICPDCQRLMMKL